MMHGQQQTLPGKLRIINETSAPQQAKHTELLTYAILLFVLPEVNINDTHTEGKCSQELICDSNMVEVDPDNIYV